MSQATIAPAGQVPPYAQIIAADLQDTESLRKYVIYCRKYPGHIMQKAWGAAKTVPTEKIKKSRAALFFYLLKKYAHHTG